MGGTETVLSHLMRRLSRDRFRPLLCCMYKPGIIGKRLIEERLEVVHSLGISSWDPRIPWRLWRLLRREKPAVLFIVNQPLTQWWGFLCGLLAGVRVRITAIRSTGKINRVERRLWINRLTFPWITKITALSQTHKLYLMERERIPGPKIEIIPNGVDLARFAGPVDFARLRAELKIPEGRPVVGIVAMLRPEKNHAMFLRAAAEVKRSVPEAMFVLVGEGEARPGLEAQAKQLGLEESVRFAGVRNDVADLVRFFDVAVLSSHPVVETLSNAVLEYMAAAKPVVSTRVGSVPEQVLDGETGFLVEPDDAGAMGARIAELLKDSGLKLKMGQAGMARVKERYTIERMIQETESLFERLIEQEGRP